MAKESKKLVVLYVEDSDSDYGLVHETLGEHIELIHARSLAECHRSGEADVALLDLNLGETIGVETVRTFHAGLPHLPIVVLTHVKDDPRLEADCIEAGAHAFYTKGSFDPASLVRSMEAAVVGYWKRANLKEEKATHRQSLAEIKVLTDVILDRLGGQQCDHCEHPVCEPVADTVVRIG